jgi:hypothetical protein
MDPLTTLAMALAEKSGGDTVDVAKAEAEGFLQKTHRALGGRYRRIIRNPLSRTNVQ